MMIWATYPASLSRMAVLSAFAIIVGGLPIAVELSEPSARIGQAAMVAEASDRVPLAARVSLSNHLALTLESGLVSPEGGSSALPRIRIDEAELLLDLSRAGAPPDPILPEPEPPTVARIGGFNAGALALRGGTLTVIGPSGNRYVVSDIHASVSAVRKGSFKLVGSGRYNGQRLSLDGAWSDPAIRDGGSQVPIRLGFRSAYLEASFDGTLGAQGSPMLTGRAEMRTPSLRRLASWTGFGAGIGDKFQSLAIAGPVEWTPKQMAFARAAVTVDGNQATGALILKLSGPRPAVDATLAFQELDLSRALLLPPLMDRRADETGPRFLTLFDADLRLSAASIKVPALDTGRGAATIALTKGRLAADLVGVEIEGGTANAQITLDVNQKTPVTTIKLKAKGVDTGRLLAAQLHRNTLLGRANVSFEGTTDTSSLRDTAMRLAGRGQLDLTEPGRLGLDLAALAYAAKAAPVVGWSAAGKGSTALEKLSCRFRVLNGALTLETLQARSGDQSLVGSGRIDVPARLMDVSIATAPAASVDLPASAPPQLSLRGTWDNPAISLVKPEPRAVKAEGTLTAH